MGWFNFHFIKKLIHPWLLDPIPEAGEREECPFWHHLESITAWHLFRSVTANRYFHSHGFCTKGGFVFGEYDSGAHQSRFLLRIVGSVSS